MSSANSTITTLSTQNQKYEAQNIQVNLDKRGELIKVYCNNVFIGIALVEKNKGELTLSPQMKESIKVLTSTTESELAKVFQEVFHLDKEQRTEAIDKKLAPIVLFIEQFSGNGRLRKHITQCDVDNLLDQIRKLEKMAPNDEVASRLGSFREIITAFKIDNVLSCKPLLERNNEYNREYYRGVYHVDIFKP